MSNSNNNHNNHNSPRQKGMSSFSLSLSSPTTPTTTTTTATAAASRRAPSSSPRLFQSITAAAAAGRHDNDEHNDHHHHYHNEQHGLNLVSLRQPNHHYQSYASYYQKSSDHDPFHAGNENDDDEGDEEEDEDYSSDVDDTTSTTTAFGLGESHVALSASVSSAEELVYPHDFWTGRGCCGCCYSSSSSSSNPKRHVSQRSSSSPRHEFPSLFVLQITAMTSLGGILFGYDLGVISSALPQLTRTFDLTSRQQEVVVSILYLGGLVGAAVGGTVCDAFGRKRAILLTDLWFLAGAILLSTANSFAMVLAGRWVVGFAVAVSGIADVSYLHEIAPTAWRGAIVSVNEASIALGFLIAFAVGCYLSSSPDDDDYDYDYDDYLGGGWRTMFGLAGILATIQLIGMWNMPESPIWLQERGRHDESEDAVRRIGSSQPLFALVDVTNSPPATTTTTAMSTTDDFGLVHGKIMTTTTTTPTTSTRGLSSMSTTTASARGALSMKKTYPPVLHSYEAVVGSTFPSTPMVGLSTHSAATAATTNTTTTPGSSTLHAHHHHHHHHHHHGSTPASPPLPMVRPLPPPADADIVSHYQYFTHQVMYLWNQTISFLVEIATQHRRQAAVALFLCVTQQFCGQVNVLNYAPIIFQQSLHNNDNNDGSSYDDSNDLFVQRWSTLSIGLVKFIVTVIVICKVETLGRRFLLLTGMTTIASGLLLLTIAFSTSPVLTTTNNINSGGGGDLTQGHDWNASAMTMNQQPYNYNKSYHSDGVTTMEYSQHDYNNNNTGSAGSGFYLALPGVLLVVTGYSMSFGPITWLVTSELFATDIRGRALGASVIVTNLCAYLVSLCFLTAQATLGASVVFGTYCIITLAGVVFAYVAIPDTGGGKSVQDIQDDLNQMPLWRQRRTTAAATTVSVSSWRWNCFRRSRSHHHHHHPPNQDKHSHPVGNDEDNINNHHKNRACKAMVPKGPEFVMVHEECHAIFGEAELT